MSSGNQNIIPRLVFSGGGTGGHLFPALAVAQYIRTKYPQSEILFIGAEGRMEMEKVPAHGFNIIGLNIAGFNRKNLLSNIELPMKVLRSYMKAHRHIKTFKPQAVVGFGGYSTVPTLLAAQRMGIPTLIQEQNSHAGMANRFLSKKAKKICAAFKGVERTLPTEKIIYTGNPVREDISALAKKSSQTQGKTVLVVGGSLGARTINQSILQGLDELEKSNLKLIWQCGKWMYDSLKESVKGRENIELKTFIDDMPAAYEQASVVVSRAGAISLSELALLGKPSILIPSPNVTDDHQTQNARELENAGAAIMITDAEAPEKLTKAIIDLVNDAQKKEQLSAAIKKFAKPEATKEIAEEVLKIAGIEA